MEASVINTLRTTTVLAKDPDAHTGSYSVNLRTVNSIAGAAAGTAHQWSRAC